MTGRAPSWVDSEEMHRASFPRSSSFQATTGSADDAGMSRRCDAQACSFGLRRMASEPELLARSREGRAVLETSDEDSAVDTTRHGSGPLPESLSRGVTFPASHSSGAGLHTKGLFPHAWHPYVPGSALARLWGCET